MSETWTGGCQCGAVRYAFEREPESVHLCHCRMCQKAVGGPFAVFFSVPKSSFRITRGEAAWFASSDVAMRGFCGDCGTPLFFHYPAGPGMGVLVATLDRPDLVPPVIQYGTQESGMPWFHGLPDLPSEPIHAEDPNGLLPRIRASNHQHPDHDTEVWPPRA